MGSLSFKRSCVKSTVLSNKYSLFNTTVLRVKNGKLEQAVQVRNKWPLPRT